MANYTHDANALGGPDVQAHYDFADPDANVGEGFYDLPSGSWPFLAKRYVESDVALHVHVYARAGKDAIPRDFCVVFEHPVLDADQLESRGEVGWREILRTCIGYCARDMDELVPVVIRQTVQNGERIILRRSVLSLKRLFVLDDCPMNGMELADPVLYCPSVVTTNRIPEVVSVRKDRKLDMFINRFIVEASKLAGGVVERGPLVIEQVPDQLVGTRRQGPARVSPDNEIPRFGLEVIDNLVRITAGVSLNQAVQRVEVCCGPAQLPYECHRWAPTMLGPSQKKP